MPEKSRRILIEGVAGTYHRNGRSKRTCRNQVIERETQYSPRRVRTEALDPLGLRLGKTVRCNRTHIAIGIRIYDVRIPLRCQVPGPTASDDCSSAGQQQSILKLLRLNRHAPILPQINGRQHHQSVIMRQRPTNRSTEPRRSCASWPLRPLVSGGRVHQAPAVRELPMAAPEERDLPAHHMGPHNEDVADRTRRIGSCCLDGINVQPQHESRNIWDAGRNM